MITKEALVFSSALLVRFDSLFLLGLVDPDLQIHHAPERNIEGSEKGDY